MTKENKTIDLGRDSIVKIFITYAIPAVLGMIAQTTAGIIDSIFIGRYVGANGIAALTVFMPIMSIVFGFASMITIGGSTLAGIYYGKNEFEKSNNYFNVTLTILVVSVAIFSVLTLVFRKNIILNTLSLSDNVSFLLIEYMQTIMYFFIPFALTFTLMLFLKLDGMPVLAVVVSASGMVINIILDYLLVGILGFGMKGAALATGLSQAIPFAILIYILFTKSKFYFKKPAFKKDDIKAMLYNGSSELLSSSAAGIAGMLFNVIIVYRIGDYALAAYGIALQVANFAFMIFYGISEAIQSPVSYNYGAENLDRIDELKKLAIITSLGIGILICGTFIIFGQQLSYIFVNDKNVASLSVSILIYYGVAVILSGVNITMTTYYTAVNQPKISIILGIVRSLFGILVGLIVLPILIGNNGIWFAIIFTEVVTIIFVSYYLKKMPYGKIS